MNACRIIQIKDDLVCDDDESTARECWSAILRTYPETELAPLEISVEGTEAVLVASHFDEVEMASALLEAV